VALGGIGFLFSVQSQIAAYRVMKNPPLSWWLVRALITPLTTLPIAVGGVLQVRPATPGPLRRGMKVALVSRVLGRRVVDVREVIDHEPDRRVEMIAPIPFGLRIRYELEGIPEGTIARIRARGRPTGRLRFVEAAINPLLRWSVIRNLERLKALLETGAWRRLTA